MITFDRNKKVHEQITEEIWCKGKMFTRSYPSTTRIEKACVVGWIDQVYGHDGRDAYERKLQKEVRKNGRFYWVPDWNDSPETKFEDVMRVLKKLDI